MTKNITSWRGWWFQPSNFINFLSPITPAFHECHRVDGCRNSRNAGPGPNADGNVHENDVKKRYSASHGFEFGLPIFGTILLPGRAK